MTFANDTLMKP